MSYTPTSESLSAHQIPDWFHDAKFGIFIHWGLYSVPAWAPRADDIQQLMKEGGMEALMNNNPYAEWYMNSMAVPSHPTYEHHRSTYGENSSYYEFQSTFEEAAAKMNADEWGELFGKAGAKYVVMVTKHHDGYVLWPTKHQSPARDNYCSKRDFVGEVSEAVRTRGMKMGLYYSGVFDWSFKPGPITTFFNFLLNQAQTQQYVEYATAHWHELIERYQPSVLWNDIGYPHGYDTNELFAHYYNTVEDGVVNDRWTQTKIPTNPVGRLIMKLVLKRIMAKAKKGGFELTRRCHFDFKTPEYAVYPEIQEDKWESCRGVGHSFGINNIETQSDMLTGEELIWMLADTVSKNGNLLLNVGPAADGTIPEMQQKPLLELGAWLSRCGDAIYGTRPWQTAEGQLADGTPVRFTARGDKVYAIIKSVPADPRIALKDFRPDGRTTAQLCGGPALEAEMNGQDTVLVLPAEATEGQTIAIEFSPGE